MIILSEVAALGNQSRMRKSAQTTSGSHKKQHLKMKIFRGESENSRVHLQVIPEKKGLITALQKTDTFNQFTEESKKNHPQPG